MKPATMTYTPAASPNISHQTSAIWCASDPFGSTMELSPPHAGREQRRAATRSRTTRTRVRLHHGRFQYDGPTGSVKSDCAMTYPSSSSASGSCGSARAAGPNTGFAPVEHVERGLVTRAQQLVALRLVQADRDSRRACRPSSSRSGRSGVHVSRPAGRSNASGSTRMSTTWPSAEPGWPSGKIVTRPSSGTSEARTGRPSSVIARKPLRHGVRPSVLPGLGPSERIGNRNATPSATSAPLMPPISSRRRVSVPSRSSASSNASRSSGVVPNGCRSSTNGPLGISACAQRIEPGAEGRGARCRAGCLRPAVARPPRRRPPSRARRAWRRRSTRTRCVRPSCPTRGAAGSLTSASRSSGSRAPASRGR